MKKLKHPYLKGIVPKGLIAIADSIIDHIGHIYDNMAPRDIIYIVAYVAATYMAYNLIVGVEKALKSPWIAIGFLPAVIASLFGQQQKEVEGIDMDALMKALVVAYMILKIDVSDVASALTKVTSAISTIGVA